MSELKEVLLNDDDIKKVSELTTKLDNLVSSLKDRDAELVKIQNNLKGALDSRAISDAISSLNNIGTAVSNLATNMKNSETAISSYSQKIVEGFDKIAKLSANTKGTVRGGGVVWSDKDFADAKQKIVELEKMLSQFNTEYSKGSKNTSENSALRQLSAQIRADIAMYRGVVQEYNAQKNSGISSNINGNTTNFSQMEQAEASYANITAAAAKYLEQLSNIKTINGEIGLTLKEQQSSIQGIATYYDKIAKSIASISGKKLPTNETNTTNVNTNVEPTVKNTSNINNAEVNSANELLRVQKELEALRNTEERQKQVLLQKEQMLLREQKARLQTEAEILLMQQKISELQATIKSAPKSEAGSIKQMQKEVSAYEKRLKKLDGTMKSTVMTSSQYYNSTGQVVQVLRELPNFAISAQTGLMSLSNNLPMLMDGLMATAKEGGGLSAVFKALISTATLLNVAFVIITIVMMNLDDIIKWLTNSTIDMDRAISDAADGIKDMSSEAGKAIADITEMAIQLYNAAEATRDGEKALDNYNNTLGKMYGYALTAADGLKKIEENMTDLMGKMLKFAIYQELIKQGQEKIAEIVSDELDSNFFTMFSGYNIGNIEEKRSEALKGLQEAANNGTEYKIPKNGVDLSMFGELGKITTPLIDLVNNASVTRKEYNDARDNLNKAIKESKKTELKGEDFSKNGIVGKFIEEVVSAAKNRRMEKLIEEATNSAGAIFEISSHYAVDNPLTSDSGSGGSGGSGFSGSIEVQKRYAKELLVSEEEDSRRRIKLEADMVTQRLIYEKKFTKGTEEELAIRTAAYQRFYNDKEELSQLDFLQSLKKIEEQREKEVKSINDRVEAFRFAIKKDQEKIDEFNRTLKEYESSTERRNLETNQDAEKKLMDKAKEDLDKKKEGGNAKEIEEASNTYNRLKENYEKLTKRAQKYKIAQDQLAIAQANQNANVKEFNRLLKSQEEALEMVDKNYGVRQLRAQTEYVRKVANLRRESIQNYEKITRVGLLRDIQDIEDATKRAEKNIERVFNKRSSQNKNIGGNDLTWYDYSDREEKYNAELDKTKEKIKSINDEIAKTNEEWLAITENGGDDSDRLNLEEHLNKLHEQRIFLIKEQEAELKKIKDLNQNEISDWGDSALEIIGGGLSDYKRDAFSQKAIDTKTDIARLREEKKLIKSETDQKTAKYEETLTILQEYASAQKFSDAEIDSRVTAYKNQRTEILKANNGGKELTAEQSGQIDADAALLKGDLQKINLEVGVDGTETAKDLEDLKNTSKASIEELNTEIDDKLKSLNEQLIESIKETTKTVIQDTMAYLDAMVKASLDKQQQDLDKWSETQNKMLEDQYASGTLTEKEYNAQKDALAEEQRKKQHEIDMKEFKYNRAKSISEIGIATAVAIAFAAKNAFEYGGMTSLPLFLTYSALLGASAAMQIAAVSAAVAPAYKEGTDFHEGGLAFVGDGGRSELIQTPSGELYKTPNKTTLVNLEKGTRVYPNFDKAVLGYDTPEIKVIAENEKQLSLLKQTNRSLSVIARNTKTQRHNYNLRNW